MLNQEEPVSVGQRLAMVADRSPAAPALVTDDHVLSYQELRDRVARLAGLLADRGVRPGEPVGLLLERGSDFVVGWLAAIWLGAVALPLDPADPADRNTGVLRRCGARAVLTHARHTGQLGPTQPLVVAVDRERLAAATATAVAPAAVPDGRAPAAICCTSGSTGLPKTVLVPHEAVLAGADFVARHCGAGAGDGHVLKTAVNFTSVLRQVGWPLLTGGWTYVLPASAGQDLTVLSRALTVHPITMCSFFPSTLNAMLAAGLPLGDSLRHLMFGGEPLPGELVRRAAGATGAELHNVYGMTECNLALWLRCAPDADFEVAPLGEPVDGLTVTVDESAGHGEGVPGGAGP
ncbi:MAG TPA: AMP-binding protein, partial [Micromonospora sp.]